MTKKSAAVAALTELAMRKLGAANPRQLADELGWTDRDGERRAHRLVTGASDAQWSTLQPMLLAAGLLKPDAVRALGGGGAARLVAAQAKLGAATRRAREQQPQSRPARRASQK